MIEDPRFEEDKMEDGSKRWIFMHNDGKYNWYWDMASPCKLYFSVEYLDESATDKVTMIGNNKKWDFKEDYQI